MQQFAHKYTVRKNSVNGTSDPPPPPSECLGNCRSVPLGSESESQLMPNGTCQWAVTRDAWRGSIQHQHFMPCTNFAVCHYSGIHGESFFSCVVQVRCSYYVWYQYCSLFRSRIRKAKFNKSRVHEVLWRWKGFRRLCPHAHVPQGTQGLSTLLLWPGKPPEPLDYIKVVQFKSDMSKLPKLSKNAKKQLSKYYTDWLG